jgi:outer membrane protein W
MRRWNVAMIAGAALLVASPEAKAADSRMALRGGADVIRTTGEWTGDLLLTEGLSITKLKAESTIGARLSLEYKFTPLIGGEVSVLRASHEISETEIELLVSHERKFGQVTDWPILLGANFHVLRNKSIDLYVGPVIGWVIWGDLKPTAAAQQDVTIGPIRMQDGFAWGVNVGVDLPFARHWAFNLDLRDLDYSARTDSRAIKAVLGEDAKIPIKPLIATAGFVLRW